jgi:hypothetical protein
MQKNYRINDKNTLYLSGYFSKDAMAYHDLFDFNWGNATGTMRWNHVWAIGCLAILRYF